MSDTNGTTLPHPGNESLTPEAARQRVRETRIANRLKREEIRAKQLEIETKALESWGRWNDPQGYGGSDVGLWGLVRDQYGYGGVPLTSPSDRRGGGQWPIWRTEAQLSEMRQASRLVCAYNSYARGYRKNLVNNVIGKGFTYKAIFDTDAALRHGLTVQGETGLEADKDQGDALAKAVQSIIDDFIDRNRWTSAKWSAFDADTTTDTGAAATREREIYGRVLRDGEAFVRLTLNDDGSADARFADPELVRQPPGASFEKGWSYGIKWTVYRGDDELDSSNQPAEDLERREAFFVARHDMGLSSKKVMDKPLGEIVPATHMVQIMSEDQDAEVMRGMPFFSGSTLMALMRADKLQNNLSVTAAGRATIAEVWQHAYGTQPQIAAMPVGVAQRSVYPPGGSNTNGVPATYNYYQPGAQRRIPAGQEWVNVNTGLGISEFQAAGQGDLRQAGAAGCAPEYVVSGDASNGNFACHDSATELLTKRGWLKWQDIQYGDVAGTMNPVTGEFEWQEIEAIHVHDYKGDMIRLKGKHNLDLLVTPNHRMYTARSRSERPGGRKGKIRRVGLHPFQFVRADELQPGSIIPPACKPKRGVPREVIMLPGVSRKGDPNQKSKDLTIALTPFMRYLGWWVSEGWTHADKYPYAIGISQSVKAVKECQDIRESVECVRDAGVKVREYDQKNGMKSWLSTSKTLWSWLRQFCGTGSYTKCLPMLVDELPATQQQQMLESLSLGDGHHKSDDTFVYFTVSQHLANQVQSLAVQCGYTAHIRKIMSNGVIPVVVKKGLYHVRVRQEHISRVPYDGKVWCVTVPNGLTITRRGGKAIVTGNSLREAGTPWVSNGEAEQENIKGGFAKVMQRVVKHGAAIKGLPEVWAKVIKLQIEAPKVSKDDKLEVAQINAIKKQNGVLSAKTWQMQDGLDPKVEEANIAEEKEAGAGDGLPDLSSADANPFGGTGAGGTEGPAPQVEPLGHQGLESLPWFDVPAHVVALLEAHAA